MRTAAKLPVGRRMENLICKMPECKCESFDHLELTRKVINRRARASKSIKTCLQQIAQHPDGEHILLQCPACGQHWQRSLAWNWGNKEYLFRVPSLDATEWVREPFVQPDELLIFDAVMRRFIEKLSSESSENPCKRDGCGKRAAKFSVFCRTHHIEELQKIHQLPQSPLGRWFAPYHSKSFELST